MRSSRNRRTSTGGATAAIAACARRARRPRGCRRRSRWPVKWRASSASARTAGRQRLTTSGSTRLPPRGGRHRRTAGRPVRRATECPPMVAHAANIARRRRRRGEHYRSVAKFVVPNAFVAGRLCDLDAAEADVDTTHLHFTGLPTPRRGSMVFGADLRIGVETAKLPGSSPRQSSSGVSRPRPVRTAGSCSVSPSVAGLGDTAAGALGAGMVEAGQLLDTAGTASVLALSATSFRPDYLRDACADARCRARPVDRAAYLAGGDLLRWLPQVLGGSPLEVLIEEASASSGGRLFFVPHLGGRILPAVPQARSLGRSRPVPNPR